MIHIQRLSRPRVNPPRLLALGTLAMLLALSMARPAVSHPPADLSRVPGPIDFDWFYLFPLPLQDHYPGYALWAAVGALTLLLFAMPWLPPMRRSPAAVVDLDNCNGCGRCVADCPFDAVTLRPRTDGAAFAEEAVVDPDICVSCGCASAPARARLPSAGEAACRPASICPISRSPCCANRSSRLPQRSRGRFESWCSAVATEYGSPGSRRPASA